MISKDQQATLAVLQKDVNNPDKRPASRSSSTQAENGSSHRESGGISKPSDKGLSDPSYSMNRWLKQKEHEEPWSGLRR